MLYEIFINLLLTIGIIGAIIGVVLAVSALGILYHIIKGD